MDRPEEPKSKSAKHEETLDKTEHETVIPSNVALVDEASERILTTTKVTHKTTGESELSGDLGENTVRTSIRRNTYNKNPDVDITKKSNGAANSAEYVHDATTENSKSVLESKSEETVNVHVVEEYTNMS